MTDPFDDLWAAYAEHGIEALIPFLTEDVVWEEVQNAPGAQTWRGRDGVRALYRRWTEDFDGFHFERRGAAVAVADDAIATPVRVVGSGRASGIDVDWELFLVTRLRDGMIAHAFYAESVAEAHERLDAG